MLMWLENHFYDFLQSDRLMHIFNMFIELVISKSAYYQVLEWKNALAMVLDQQVRKSSFRRLTVLASKIQAIYFLVRKSSTSHSNQFSHQYTKLQIV